MKSKNQKPLVCLQTRKLSPGGGVTRPRPEGWAAAEPGWNLGLLTFGPALFSLDWSMAYLGLSYLPGIETQLKLA